MISDNEETPEAAKGRPSVYTPEVGETICGLLAEGKSLTSICKRDDIPVSDRTVRTWAADPEHPFSPQYARAREVGYSVMADQMLDLADNVSEDQAAVAKVHRQIETRKWLLSKALPKVYGDKLAIGGDPDTGPIKHVIEHVYVRPPGS